MLTVLPPTRYDSIIHLALQQANGEVAQLYTGWIDEETMEQVISDAVRGL